MSSYDDTLKATIEVLRRHVPPGRVIAPTDHIQADLGLDSLSVMEAVCDVEARFEVVIPNAMLDTMSTVQDVAKTIVTLTAAPQAPARSA